MVRNIGTAAGQAGLDKQKGKHYLHGHAIPEIHLR